MKRLILTFLVLLFAVEARSVEVLVKVAEHWQQLSDIPEGTTKDTIAWLKDMWKQTHKGEIIVVKPNGWNWGGMENPPRFVVIKIPDATMAQAAKYLDGLVDSQAVAESDSVTVKERRWHFTKAFVDLALNVWYEDTTLTQEQRVARPASYITLPNAEAASAVRQYDVANIKQRIKDRLRQ